MKRFWQCKKSQIGKTVLIFSLICMSPVLLCGCGGDKEDEKLDLGQLQLYQDNIPDSGYVVPYDAPVVNPYLMDGNTGNIWDSGNSEKPSSQIRCSTCRQTGKCPDCGGSGRIYRTRYSIDLGSGSSSYEEPVVCALCDGDGECYKCQGTGFRTY